MEAKDFLLELLGVNTQKEEPAAEAPENDLEEEKEEKFNPSENAEDEAGISKDEMRMMVREELKSLFEEAKKAKDNAQEAARAASVGKVPERETRTVEDIMAERYKNALGVKKGE